jgi:tetratricopeptide (TPR) repeat protein
MDDRDVVALWDFDQPAVSGQRFEAEVARAESDGRAADAVLMRSQVARALGLRREFAESAAELDRAEAGLAQLTSSAPLLRVYLDLERGRMLRSSGDPAAARPLFLRAFATAEEAGLGSLAADAAHMVALVGDADDQIAWGQRALAIATAAADAHTRRWITSIENNLGWTLHDAGRFTEAQEHFDRALVASEERGEPERIRIAHWTVARGLRSLGRFDEALAIQQRLHASGPEDRYVEEELAELLTALGRPDEAVPHADRARQLN